jgi:hypothetical protein
MLVDCKGRASAAESELREKWRFPMRNVVAIAVILGLFAVVPALAVTCPGTVVFHDDFTTLNPTLNAETTEGSKVTVQGGKAEITFLKAPMGRAMEYQGTQYGDGNVCLTVSPLASDKAEDQTAGIIFWASDLNNFYVFEVQVNGAFCVSELSLNGTWTFAVPWQTSAATKQGVGVANTLRVQTAGITATLFINDQQVGTFTGTPPGGTSQVGFYAGSSTKTAVTWDVSDLSVTKP